MDNNQNKYIAVSYMLYDVTDGKQELIEQTSEDRPFDFLSGFGFTLPAFEEAVVKLKSGEDFELMLTPDQAYGEHIEEHVLDLDKQIFSINGKFDSEHIVVDAVVPLQNEDGNRFNGHILEITDDKVKVDLNHPLAGKALKFVGSIKENRDATNDEIGQYMNMVNGNDGCGGCNGCEGDCEGGCGDDKKDGGCCGCH